MTLRMRLNRRGKNTILAFFPLAKFAAKLLTARKITTYVAILGSHRAIHAGSGILPRPVTPAVVPPPGRGRRSGGSRAPGSDTSTGCGRTPTGAGLWRADRA